MSDLVKLRHRIDFAEDGVTLAKDGPGELSHGLDELIDRLAEEGLLDELTAHHWIHRSETFDRGSVPKPRRKGCLFTFLRLIGRSQ